MLASLREVTARGAEPSRRELADFAGRADAHDTRIARLALTPRGVGVIDDAIAVVHPLMHRLTAPLGGSDGQRLAALARQLKELLAVQPSA